MSSFQWTVVAITVGLNALDGFDVLSISFASPGITQEWGIDRAALGIVLSMELVGMAVGSLLLGGVADRLGRRRTILGCLVVMTRRHVPCRDGLQCRHPLHLTGADWAWDRRNACGHQRRGCRSFQCSLAQLLRCLDGGRLSRRRRRRGFNRKPAARGVRLAQRVHLRRLRNGIVHPARPVASAGIDPVRNLPAWTRPAPPQRGRSTTRRSMSAGMRRGRISG